MKENKKELREKKIKAIIREACYMTLAIDTEMKESYKKSGNPYSAVDYREELAQNVNSLTNEAYGDIKRFSEESA